MLIQPVVVVDQIVVVDPVLIQKGVVELIVYGPFVVEPYAAKVEDGKQLVLEV